MYKRKDAAPDETGRRLLLFSVKTEPFLSFARPGPSSAEAGGHSQDHQDRLHHEQHGEQGDHKLPPLLHLDAGHTCHDGGEAGGPHDVGQAVAELEGQHGDLPVDPQQIGQGAMMGMEVAA